MHDTVLGNLKHDVTYTDDALTIDGKEIKLLSGRDPAAMPWKDLGVEVIIESTGAFNSLDGGSKHLEAGAINGFGRIGRNVLRCWLKRETKPFDIVAINAGSMSPQTTAHLLKYDTVLGTLKADVTYTDDALTIDGKVIKLLSGRDPAAMPWKELGVEVIIESTGAFNSLEGGSKHLEAGAKKVILTAPGKNCPTYVVGVNEGDYDAANDTVVSNASCTTNGMASVCKVLDESFGVQYGMMTTTHSYTGDQMILDGRHRDLRRARAGACNIVPTSTGAAKAVAEVLPQYKGKLNGIALRVPTPNVSVVDLVVKVGKECD